MSKQTTHFTAILLRRPLLSPKQLEEAVELVRRTGMKLTDVLVKLGYATNDQVMSAIAEASGLQFINLAEVTIPVAVIELVPESVARENIVLPVAHDKGVLHLAMHDPTDFDTVQKLQFILNKDIQLVLASREQIVEAINRHYGQADTESVDSMLMEFTDTAIDFTEIETTPVDSGPTAPAEAASNGEAHLQPGRVVERQATVRYYHRINPERMFPLLVVLSPKQVLEAVKRNVSQASSGRFAAALGSAVEVEPILPGCSCYPPKETMTIREGDASTTFWVVPHVLGQVMQARVVVRQGATVLAEVPLEVRVVKQGLTLLLGTLSLLLPPFLLLLKQFHLDFESQREQGFGLYAQLLQWAVDALSPEILAGFLLLATGTAYLWLRPRRRDVFWDIKTVDAPDSPPVPARTGTPTMLADAAASLSPNDLLKDADVYFAAGEYPKALEHYERGLRVHSAQPVTYFRASLAAFHSGDPQRALAILELARASLHPGQMTGSMWYNMGCFCTRLGRFAEAIRYLNRAVDAGQRNVAKYAADPDLAPLRWRGDFKRLLHTLQTC